MQKKSGKNSPPKYRGKFCTNFRPRARGVEKCAKIFRTPGGKFLPKFRRGGLAHATTRRVVTATRRTPKIFFFVPQKKKFPPKLTEIAKTAKTAKNGQKWPKMAFFRKNGPNPRFSTFLKKVEALDREKNRFFQKRNLCTGEGGPNRKLPIFENYEKKKFCKKKFFEKNL